MTGTYAGQFVMEGFISLKISPWKRVLITRLVAIIPAIVVAILAQENLDSLDEWLNVLQSIQLPFALVPILVFTSDPTLMGPFSNSIFVILPCIVITILVLSTNTYLIINFTGSSSFPMVLNHPGFFSFLGVVGTVYLMFLFYLIFYKSLKNFASPCSCNIFKRFSNIFKNGDNLDEVTQDIQLQEFMETSDQSQV
eukprot:TRINITY_DN6410_c0_g1_i2.p1 TRINITY_DN6410_c0_g1~~TRINITY_DN6410_c0_g1_i2.p1  ORF type:complete len:196 (+),score=25.28 TRINITY_DN6410_c0_g1_i2:932-1519(+)